MNDEQLQHIVEGAIFAAGEPLSLVRLQALFVDDSPPKARLIEIIAVLQKKYDRYTGIELQEVSSGYRFQVKASLSPWVSRLWEEKPPRYSRALLETLVLIAYRQPITRGEIEAVRGVAVSSTLIRTLLEREWVRVIGHKDVPGRPALYATTKIFLDYFDLMSLDQLPPLAELMDLDDSALDSAMDQAKVAVAEALDVVRQATEATENNLPVVPVDQRPDEIES